MVGNVFSAVFEQSVAASHQAVCDEHTSIRINGQMKRKKKTPDKTRTGRKLDNCLSNILATRLYRRCGEPRSRVGISLDGIDVCYYGESSSSEGRW